MSPNTLLVVFGLLLAAGAPLPASAEKADRNKPIQLEADHATVDDARQIAVFTGNVVLTQGTTVLRGDKMEVRQDKAGFRNGTVWGNLAYFKQKRDGTDEIIEGWSERIEYDSRADKVQMFNRAMLKRGQDEVRGSYISYDATTDFFQVTGGASNTAGPKPGEGRVRAVMQPKPKDAAEAAPAVPLRRESSTSVPRAEVDAGK